MKKSYIYKGQIYSSEKEVRNAIFADRRLAFIVNFQRFSTPYPEVA